MLVALRVIALLLLVVCGTIAQAETNVYFRHDRGLADRDERSLPDDLSAKETLKWRTPLAPGHSSPCISGDAIYLTTFDEQKKLHTVALDRATGKLRWSQPCPATRLEQFHPTGSPAASTPACDGSRVYAMFGSYGLIAYDLSGKEVWTKPMAAFQDEFGSASSPILVDGKLLLVEDHDKDSFVLCVDAASGKTIWQTPREDFTRSYATPIIWESAGRKQLIVPGALQLVAYDLATGKVDWKLSGLARIVNTTPAVSGGVMYIASWTPGGDTDARIGMEPWDVALRLWDKDNDKKLTRAETDNKDVLDRFYRIDLDQNQSLDQYEWQKYAKVFELARNSVMAVRPAEAGKLEPPQVLWTFDKGVPYVASPLFYRDVFYMVKDGGIFTSLDPATGKPLRQARAAGTGNYYASPIAGDGKVYLVSEKGVISVIKAAGDWSVISSHDLAERSIATPVIADGKIFVRTEAALYCFGK
jgi:outer membrane protein assembly factor BamB